MIGQLSYRQRIIVLLGLLALAVLGALALPPIPQDPGYHMFADSRSLLGIPNFNDVVSNAGFALVGIFGALMVWRERNRDTFERAADARPYLCFFFGVALVSLGSAYYHWAPSNDRLFWDRLAMSIGFMAISAAVVADRIDTDRPADQDDVRTGRQGGARDRVPRPGLRAKGVHSWEGSAGHRCPDRTGCPSQNRAHPDRFRPW